MPLIAKSHSCLSLVQQCGLLSVNCARFYYRPVVSTEQDVTQMNEIRDMDIWQGSPFYGYRRIYAVLRRQGWPVNHKRVQHLMKVMRVQALYPKPKTTIPSMAHKVYPYLLKGLEITYPNQVWATDIPISR